MTNVNSENQVSRRNRWLRPLIILGVALLIVALLMLTKSTPPKAEIKEKEWLVSVEKVQSGNARPQIALLGNVESPFDSTLSAAISADVLSVPVREGLIVAKGDLLIQLDDREIKLMIEQRQADVGELQAQIIAENNRFHSDTEALKEEQNLLEIAVKAVRRQAQLKASNLVAQERYDEAESERAQKILSINARQLSIADHPSRLKQLQARLARAVTALNDTLLDQERTRIEAPFDGVITQVSVAPGERVQVGQALASLYDNKNMEVRAQIPDRYVSLIESALSKSSVITASSESYGRPIQLQLKRLSGQANRGYGGIDALFIPVKTSEGQAGLILNSALKINVELPQLSDVVTLPLSSIYGSNRIYRVEEGRIQSLDVEILGKQFSGTGSDRVIIRSKILNEGDAIIITQLPNAISGLKVKLRTE